MPYVSFHAQQRFALWVNAMDDPVQCVLDIWRHGEEAQPSDFTLFGTKRREGYTYRVCQYKYLVVMVVAHGSVIVTVLDQKRTSPRVLRAKSE